MHIKTYERHNKTHGTTNFLNSRLCSDLSCILFYQNSIHMDKSCDWLKLDTSADEIKNQQQLGGGGMYAALVFQFVTSFETSFFFLSLILA